MSNFSLRSLRLTCALALSASLCCLPAFAQTSGNGNIAGVVTDPSGAAVPAPPSS